MKYLKYFENNSHIEDICKKYNIEDYTINNDGSNDVNDVVILANKNLTEIPINFKEVYFSFSCSYNPNLKSLKGSPEKCYSFICSNIAIETLEHAPDIVDFTFNCSNNINLKSLKGAPKRCFEFGCRYNPLIKSFEGLEDTDCDYYSFSCSPIDRLYSLFEDPKRFKEFIDLEITEGQIVKQYRL